MDNSFETNERLFRAVIPNDMYWKENGEPASAAFKTRESDGLSTDRAGGRCIEDCVKRVHEHLGGKVVSVSCGECWEVNADVVYAPIDTESDPNPYHTLIRNKDKASLTNGQAKALSRICILHE